MRDPFRVKELKEFIKAESMDVSVHRAITDTLNKPGMRIEDQVAAHAQVVDYGNQDYSKKLSPKTQQQIQSSLRFLSEYPYGTIEPFIGQIRPETRKIIEEATHNKPKESSNQSMTQGEIANKRISDAIHDFNVDSLQRKGRKIQESQSIAPPTRALTTQIDPQSKQAKGSETEKTGSSAIESSASIEQQIKTEARRRDQQIKAQLRSPEEAIKAELRKRKQAFQRDIASLQTGGLKEARHPSPPSSTKSSGDLDRSAVKQPTPNSSAKGKD